MPRSSRWKESAIKNGIGTVHLSSWKYFLDYIYQEMLHYEQYVWRGQRCDDWPLESTLDRLIRTRDIPTKKRTQFRSSHLQRFKYAARGRRGKNPIPLESENVWWALGQHHGLATPLLDWTSSPFVAAYFAFIDTGTPQTQRRAVYAVAQRSVQTRSLSKHDEQQAAADERHSRQPWSTTVPAPLPPIVRPPVEFIRPLSDENDRLVNQAGLFSRAPDDVCLDSWIAEEFKGQTDGYTLMQITIPNKDRDRCLRSLNRMNINHLTLFPDLYGASKHCNHCLDIGGY